MPSQVITASTSISHPKRDGTPKVKIDSSSTTGSTTMPHQARGYMKAANSCLNMAFILLRFFCFLAGSRVFCEL